MHLPTWVVIAVYLVNELHFSRLQLLLAELRQTAALGGRFAWAQPIIMLLIGVELFMGHLE